MIDSPVLCLLETTITRLLVNQPVDFMAVLRKNNDRHTEEEILHVRSLFELKQRKAVTHQPAFYLRVSGRLLRIYIHVLQTGTIAGNDIKQFVLAHHFVYANHFNQLKRQLVVIAEFDILHALTTGNR